MNDNCEHEWVYTDDGARRQCAVCETRELRVWEHEHEWHKAEGWHWRCVCGARETRIR